MNHFKSSLLLFLPILFLMMGYPLQAQKGKTKAAASTLEQQIDQIFVNYDDIKKPGATVAVVKDNTIVFKKGYGSANLEYDIPNTPSTVFHIASVSKQFTVFAILLLEKEGKLSFDDDIRKHIPEVPDFGQTITLRHLAAHTSGMRDQWSLLGMAGWRWDDVITTEHILKLVKKQKELNFEPGEEYTYSNTGFTLLAEAVARVSGQTFAEFTEEKIFKPLKMSNTLFYDDHEKIVQNRAYSYYQNDGIYKKSVLSYANVGATSLFTTVEDLSLWAMNFSNLTVGDKDIIDKMSTLAELNNGENFGGAYGQFVNQYKGLNRVEHGGADAGYRTYFGRFPDQNFAVMVFSNLASANPNGLATQVADLYLKDFYGEETVEKPVKEKAKFIKLTTKELESFEGNFWNEAGQYARKIYVKNDTLRYNRGGTNESMLVPIASNKFQMLNIGSTDLTVEFNEKKGKPTMIVVINGGSPIVSEAFTPPNYSAADLKQFEGTFFSPELSTSYFLMVEGDKLVVKHPRISDFNMKPAKLDLFSTDNGMARFIRDKDKNITGLRFSDGRAKNVWFEKKKE